MLEQKLKEGVMKIEHKQKQTVVNNMQILELDPTCFSDFDLLEAIPKPKTCTSLMTKEDAELLMKQRLYWMEEMERFSQELMGVIEEM